MIKILVTISVMLVLPISAMDDNQVSIDMMVLKQVSIEKLREVIRTHKAAQVVSNGERAYTLYSPCLTVKQKIYPADVSDFASAVRAKIAAIEQKNGYQPEKRNVESVNESRYYLATNYLDLNTRYWHRVDTDMPYVECESIFYDTELPKKALAELGAPYRECVIM